MYMCIYIYIMYTFLFLYFCKPGGWENPVTRPKLDPQDRGFLGPLDILAKGPPACPGLPRALSQVLPAGPKGSER